MQMVEGPLGLLTRRRVLRARSHLKELGHSLAVVNVRCDALSVGGEQHVRWYRSSDKVERGF